MEHGGHGGTGSGSGHQGYGGQAPPARREGHEGKGGSGHGGGGPAHGHGDMARDMLRRFVVCLVLTVPILILTPEVQGLFGLSLDVPYGDLWLLALSTVVFVYGGWPFLTGLVREVRNRLPGMMTLIGLAISIAYVYSAASVLYLGGSVFFWELATLIDVMLLGHYLEMRSVAGASRALEELAKVLPAEADLLRDGQVVKVRSEELGPGDMVLVRPGSKVPADGSVVDGVSEVNESLLTGESRPIPKAPGQEVIGGSVNGDGSLTVRITRTGRDTYLGQVVDLVRTAQESRSRSQDLADRAALALTIIAIVSGAVTFAAWLLFDGDAGFAVERAVTVMVICCPHALGLAIPLVVATSTVLAARSGFLVRERDAFERARNVDVVVFDKTGTLTEGDFGLVAIKPAEGVGEDDALRLAAAVEASSEHSIARGILDAARARGLSWSEATNYRNIPGRGAVATVDGEEHAMLSPSALEDHGVKENVPDIAELARGGRTVVLLTRGRRALAAFALADRTRKESAEAISRLRSEGVRTMMITGDSDEVAAEVTRELGIDEYRAAVPPAGKAAVVQEMQGGSVVAMVGDGINDAPALVQADVGIAIGAGTDVAVGSADIILIRDDPRDVPAIIALSRRTYSKMVQNLIYATGYNAVAIPLAAGALAPWGIVLTPAAGAALMSISTIVVAVNARLLR
ncbi:MAG: cadmium-translocating P-type ATPase [Methanomassiliicoccus sp.]|nr:cadmium-translocating P-type ATPase [Methanomassiliicoccus sp.]